MPNLCRLPRVEAREQAASRGALPGGPHGLGIVLALLKAHDGTIRPVDSERGTRFEIVLPVA
ncbi:MULTISPECIES: ATP-binding protein [unclassified Mesorhizobium]|uniref:ATP-binding protein n=1 Tax=unclassified Mesorhizobium TaxID=325217 RepID=UPI0011278473|nr:MULTISPECIES: ATP-binding protein [unclassified Mesorhizobium]TPK01247.1 ATP-binding protein [Mesorhizobium sp. B2-5-12]TPK26377.1 ATP-binding protein [Mesorhizobium sp. B2-5-6]TPM51532.1 ATP-binding protein [Mesorhizobium sp. B2-2-3]MCA0055341.1 ATP-binding protein [Mesorhizobium sp. B261B1A]TPI55291.1 ATP-binding protein [Mesorhizobium sp. B3-1-1]